MRIIFMGTPEFAIPSLEALARVETVVAVVTQPDRERGRGLRVAPPPVAEAGRALGLPVLQPPRLRDPSAVAALRAQAPEASVVAAYGKLILREVLDLPPHGCINVHPSLLPRHRGASPIQAAILAGDGETGVTIMYMTEELDAGDIILQRRVPVDPQDTARTLEDRLARLGAEALVEALALIKAGRATRTPQDPAAATYSPKLTKEDGRIDWSRPVTAIARQVRAMDPWPTAFTWHRGILLKVWRAGVAGHPGAAVSGRAAGVEVGRAAACARGTGAPPGTVLEVGPAGITVAAGEGALRLEEVQPAGGRQMTAAEYARGHRLQAGEVLGGSNLRN
ncbi:MAG: methionyl-tRNA formyltransferase [Armatimonadetes bacterium]|nr:methionyl-tRNA formyltransferase [Armatimonadota bacterium]